MYKIGQNEDCVIKIDKFSMIQELCFDYRFYIYLYMCVCEKLERRK